MRLLVLIIARNVGPSIAEFFARMQPPFGASPSTELLFIDDASTDDTFEQARKYRTQHDFHNLRIIQTPREQGFAGNQKVGFRFALDKSFDAIMVLNADCTYNAQALRELADALATHDADAVLGIAPGMSLPLLGTLQSRVAGVSIKGWHSLYKGYLTRALMRIAFELNTSDPAFETELLLQLMDQGCRIAIVPLTIPAGLSDSRRQTFDASVEHLKSCLKYRLQKYNLFYDFRYHPDMLDDPARRQLHTTPYSPKLDVNSPHSYVCRDVALIPPGSKVLDIGCSTGYVAEYLVESRNCRVVGIDQLPASAMAGKKFTYHEIDLEKDFTGLRKILEEGAFDVILMLDVLEHLTLPELFLLRLRQVTYQKQPVVIFSTGNVAFIVIRLMLMMGYFNYGQKGILDITHKRLFSFRTFKNVFDQTGFIILERIGFPLPYRTLGFPDALARLLEMINTALIKLWRSLFAYQIMFVTTPLVLPEHILAKSLNPDSQVPSTPASLPERL